MSYEDILKYLEGAAYITIVLAVLGVPQMLSSYFDIRERRRTRGEDRLEAERIRQEADRRHTEMMTVLSIIAGQRNGHRDDTERDDSANAEILRRLTAIEAALGLTPKPVDPPTNG